MRSSATDEPEEVGKVGGLGRLYTLYGTEARYMVFRIKAQQSRIQWQQATHKQLTSTSQVPHK